VRCGSERPMNTRFATTTALKAPRRPASRSHEAERDGRQLLFGRATPGPATRAYGSGLCSSGLCKLRLSGSGLASSGASSRRSGSPSVTAQSLSRGPSVGQVRRQPLLEPGKLSTPRRPARRAAFPAQRLLTATRHSRLRTRGPPRTGCEPTMRDSTRRLLERRELRDAPFEVEARVTRLRSDVSRAVIERRREANHQHRPQAHFERGSAMDRVGSACTSSRGRHWINDRISVVEEVGAEHAAAPRAAIPPSDACGTSVACPSG